MADSESTEKREVALDYTSALDDAGLGAFLREALTGDAESPDRLAAQIPRV